MAPIYHIAKEADWQRARLDGQYTVSTLGRSLAEEGFIHASTAAQVAGVANAFFQGEDGLVVLVIDPDLVGPQIRWEHVPGGATPFPHIYGPLSPDAVTGTLPLARDAAGRFTFSHETGGRESLSTDVTAGPGAGAEPAH
jgi:uncharacterized protein (DUF952 family)